MSSPFEIAANVELRMAFWKSLLTFLLESNEESWIGYVHNSLKFVNVDELLQRSFWARFQLRYAAPVSYFLTSLLWSWKWRQIGGGYISELLFPLNLSSPKERKESHLEGNERKGGNVCQGVRRQPQTHNSTSLQNSERKKNYLTTVYSISIIYLSYRIENKEIK